VAVVQITVRQVNLEVQVAEEVILKRLAVMQLNQHNQAIVVLTDLVTQVVQDSTQVPQLVLKAEAAVVPVLGVTTQAVTTVVQKVAQVLLVHHSLEVQVVVAQLI